jgi:hypothetical protein
MAASILSRYSDFSAHPVSKFVRDGGHVSYFADNGLALAQFTARTFSPLDSSGKLSKVDQQAGAARSFRDVLDIIPALFDIVTLQFLFERNADGKFKLVEGTKYVFKHVCDILNSAVLLACRILNIGTWLHKLKAVDLGKHFERFGYAIMAGFTVICVASVAKAVDKACQPSLAKMGAKAQIQAERKARAEIGREIIGLVSCVVAEFGNYPKTPIGTAVAGAIGMIAATWNLTNMALSHVAPAA